LAARELSGRGGGFSREDEEQEKTSALREEDQRVRAKVQESVRAREQRLAREREREEAIGERPGSTFDQTGCPEMNIRVQYVDPVNHSK
jgi:hypothetical protein